MAKRKSGGLLNRHRSITSTKKLSAPKGIKPQQARQLIRRFHILQKNKHSILNKISKDYKKCDQELTESNYKEVLSSTKEWRKFYVANADTESQTLLSSSSATDIIKIDSGMTIPQLFSQLGKIDAEIEKRGGLEAYQSASIHGQDSNRGGDSSKKLIEWLNQAPYKAKVHSQADNKLSALEIGCLNPANFISTSGIFTNVVKIDLNSQSQQILQQNFMERPLPADDSERFNMISCSLVLNFVPTPLERGEMLRRLTKFLLPPAPNCMSSLFFVLPLPCLENSRYIDTTIFESMMSDLGFKKVFSYQATKLIYYLFDWEGMIKSNVKYPKKQCYEGSKRNNFCIVLE